MKYEIQWRYKSSLGGPWQKGDVVELDVALAEAINRDSPGVLVAEESIRPAPPPKKADRMVRKAQTRKVKDGDEA